MSQIKAIISDADGTLVNTVFLIRHGQYEAVFEYLTTLGLHRHEIPPYELYESYINQSVGGSTRETFEKTLTLMFSKSHPDLFKKIDFEKLDASLAPIQDHIAPLYVHPFHGLTELFTWLGESKTDFGIFTSGNRRMIVRNFGVSLPVMGYTDLFLSDEIGIGERLEAFKTRAKAVYGIPSISIITCEDVTKTKPDPEGILKIMDTFGVQPSEVIALGDHITDMQAAKAAGVHSIGISHGFGIPADLTAAGAIHIVDDLASLPKLIEAHNSGQSKLF